MTSLHLPRLHKWLLSSPPAEWAISQLRQLLINALKQGPIPQHIAFVMDGNRRFARKNRIEAIEGHNQGFETLARVLEVCYQTGVHTVTIYAFSTENFKRPKYEVDALMEMARTKLAQLSQHGELLQRYGARIRILGQRELVTPEVLKAVDDAVGMTEGNGGAVLNVCFPYTSRDEITAAVRGTVEEFAGAGGEGEVIVDGEATREDGGGRRRGFSERTIERRLSTLREESTSPAPDATGRRQRKESTQDSASTNGDTLHPSSAAIAGNISQQPSTIDDQPPPQAPTTNGHLSASTSSSFSSTTTLNHDPLNTSNRSSPASSPPQSAPMEPHRQHPHDPPNPESITAAHLSRRMYTHPAPAPDLLIRTSGVERLSDFMLWQCHESTCIRFLKCLWPEFGLLQFLPVLVEWQWWVRNGGGVG